MSHWDCDSGAISHIILTFSYQEDKWWKMLLRIPPNAVGTAEGPSYPPTNKRLADWAPRGIAIDSQNT